MGYATSAQSVDDLQALEKDLFLMNFQGWQLWNLLELYFIIFWEAMVLMMCWEKAEVIIMKVEYMMLF